jgi:phosphoglycolate phosphatase
MRTLIFDFDGTIADSFVTLIGVFEEVTKRKQKFTADEIEKLRGLPLKGILKNLKIKRWQIPRLLIKGRRAMTLKVIDIRPFKGLTEVLAELSQEDYRMFILSTNSPENINEFLKANKLEAYFERICGNIGLRKAAALKKLMKREDLRPSQSIYIGDEIRDVEAARKAGLAVISVGWGFNHPGILKQSRPDGLAIAPNELITLIKKLN